MSLRSRNPKMVYIPQGYIVALEDSDLVMCCPHCRSRNIRTITAQDDAKNSHPADEADPIIECDDCGERDINVIFILDK